MSTEIQIFNFESEENQIRIIGTADDPKFCLADICKVLGLTARSFQPTPFKQQAESSK